MNTTKIYSTGTSWTPEADEMAQQKVVLLSPYSQETTGIRSIYHHLHGHGVEAYLIYYQRYSGIDTKHPPGAMPLLIDTLRALQPTIIGISTYTFSYRVVQDIVLELKANGINAFIVIGGPHPMLAPETCIGMADAVCIWEGEESLLELVRRIARGEDYTTIPNLWINHDGKIIKNGIKPIQDLDTISLPDYTSKNFIYIEGKNLFRGYWRLLNDVHYFATTSRGCPYRCAYCTNSLFSEMLDSTEYKGKYVRRRSVENVMAELRLAKEHYPQMTKIKIYDDIFPTDKEWLKRFCELYKRDIDKPFWCDFHAHYVKDDVVKMLKDAGMVNSNIGVESGCEKFRLQTYNKPVTNEQVMNAVKIFKKHKVLLKLNIITCNPLETDEDLREGVRFLLTLPRGTILTLCKLTHLPSTKLTEELIAKGYITKPDMEFEDYVQWQVSRHQTFNNTRDEYWYYVYNLIQKRYVPKCFIKLLATQRMVDRRQKTIRWFRAMLALYRLKDKLKRK